MSWRTFDTWINELNVFEFSECSDNCLKCKDGGSGTAVCYPSQCKAGYGFKDSDSTCVRAY